MRCLLFLVGVVTAVNGLTNLKLAKITVRMGAGNNDGTKDDVAMKICDKAKCCHTKELSHTFSSEWVKNKTEVWDGKKLGNCSKILFESGSADLAVTLLKTKSGKAGKDDLKVSSIILEGAPTTETTKKQQFTCGSFIFANTDTSKTQICLNNKPSGKRTTNVNPKTPAKIPASTASPSTAAIQIKKVTVKMGAGNNDGTDDDVVLKICDRTKCCHTKELSHTFSGEWVKNKTELWDGSKLGNCSKILFEGSSPAVGVTLLKTGKDDLKVSSIILEGGSVASKTNTHKFICGAIALPDPKSNNKPGSATCPIKLAPKPAKKTRPTTSLTPENVKIKQFKVQIGDDGTNDDVKIKVCSVPKSGAPVCCETGVLSTILHDDWSKKDNETWSGSSLGTGAAGCRDKVFKIEKGISNLNNGELKITVDKKGKDPVKITNIVVETETSAKTIKSFQCGSFSIDGKTPSSPTFSTQTCADGSSSTVSKVGACLRSGKNCGASSSRTTTRPPFRSGSGK